MWVIHWGLAPEAALEGLGLFAVSGSGVAAWFKGVLAAPVTQGCCRLGQQET